MKHTLFIFCCFLIAISCSAQDYFEGEIKYKITYKSLAPDLDDSFWVQQAGDTITAHIQENQFVMLSNSSGELGWSKVTVFLDKGYGLTEFEHLDTIYKRNFSSFQQELISIERNQSDPKEILGELCESVSIEQKAIENGQTVYVSNATHYFNPKYKLNKELYKNYTVSFWDLYAQESGAISLYSDVNMFPYYDSIQEAFWIEQKSINPTIFDIPTNKIIIEH